MKSILNLLHLTSPLLVCAGHVQRSGLHLSKPVEQLRFFGEQSEQELPFPSQFFEQTERLLWQRLRTAAPGKHHELPVLLLQLDD